MPGQRLAVAFHGANGVTKIGGSGIALQVADAVISAGEIPVEFRIVGGFAAHLFEVFERGGNERSPDLPPTPAFAPGGSGGVPPRR